MHLEFIKNGNHTSSLYGCYAEAVLNYLNKLDNVTIESKEFNGKLVKCFKVSKSGVAFRIDKEEIVIFSGDFCIIKN
jgi:hypothetical protein